MWMSLPHRKNYREKEGKGASNKLSVEKLLMGLLQREVGGKSWVHDIRKKEFQELAKLQ